METLQELTQKYKFVRMVTPDDNDELLKFLDGISMDCGPFSLKYSRFPNVIDSFKEQSDKSFIFVYLNEDQSIGGFGSLILSQLYINGQSVQAAYYADMRLSPTLSRRAHIESRQIYAESLKNYKQITELKDVKYFYTAILKNNEKALQALTKKKRGIIYHELCDYDVITMLKIRRSFKKPRFSSELISKTDTPLEQSENRLFQHISNSHEKVILKDKNKVIFSATIKKMKGRNLIISKAPYYLQLLCRLLPILRRPALKLNQEFVQRYITDIYFHDPNYKKDEIFFDFLQYIRNHPQYSKTHGYSFLHQKNDDLTHSLKKCFSQKTSGILFQVTSDEEEQTIFPTKDTEVGFDICIS